MADSADWPAPSLRVATLIRTGARALLDAPEALFDEVDAATLAAADPGLAGDPVLAGAVRSTNHLNLLHWARSNVERPGLRVAPNLGPETVGIARDLVRRGLDEASLNLYRTGQNMAWRQWMQGAFALTGDPDELRELLDVTARSIFTFVDETLAGIAAQVERERDQLTRGSHAERLEIVTLIVEGAPIGADRAAARLGYALDGRHTAAILWTHDAPGEDGRLERAADALARTAEARRPFTVVASARSLWVWVRTDTRLDVDAVRRALTELAGVRMALGPTAAGIDGFRRSHLDALAVQRLLHGVPDGRQLATFDEVQVVALCDADPERSRAFVQRTLGDLATADPVLRQTLRVYAREQFSASRAAQVLYTHRNTVLNRLQRAEQLLPAPLAGRGLEVALALEIVHWTGR